MQQLNMETHDLIKWLDSVSSNTSLQETLCWVELKPCICPILIADSPSLFDETKALALSPMMF